MQIVIDKSFLWNAGSDQLAAILRLHQAIMPDVLFYEMFKDNEARRGLFARLPARPNPILLVPGTGPLTQFEIQNRKPVPPLARHALRGKWRFHPGLASGALALEPWMVESIETQRQEYIRAARGIVEVAEILPSLFPQLAGYRNGDRRWRPHFAEARAAIGTDDFMIRRLYGVVRHHSWPRPSRVHRHTALFRLVQLHALFALSAYERFGVSPSEQAINQTIEHDARDRDYALAATLAGAIATKDNRLAKLVRAAESTCIIVGMGPTTAIRGRSYGDSNTACRDSGKDDGQGHDGAYVWPTSDTTGPEA